MAGQGSNRKAVQVDVRLDHAPVTSIIFGAQSGHPFFLGDYPNGSNLQAELVGVFAATILHLSSIHNEENFLALLEFVDHLVEEAIGDAGDFESEAPDDQVGGGYLPF